MTLKLRFALKQVVYLASDHETKGVVTGLMQRPDSSAYHYFVTWGQTESEHYECELTGERSIVDGEMSSAAD